MTKSNRKRAFLPFIKKQFLIAKVQFCGDSFLGSI